jgi:enterochelin esterase-like enzyme
MRLIALLAVLATAPTTVALAQSAKRAAPAGQLQERVLFDSSYRRQRRVWVYTPPGYDPRSGVTYPLIVAFDGDEYRDTMPLPHVLDTLLAAAKAPAFVAFRRPDLFGNVWSQSGAFWRGAEGSNDASYEWLTEQVRTSTRKDVRFFLDVGELEDHPTLGGSGPNFRDANRRFRDALKAKGYDVTYLEVPGGNHAERCWRERLPVGSVALSAHAQSPQSPQPPGGFNTCGNTVCNRAVTWPMANPAWPVPITQPIKSNGTREPS